MPFPWAVLAAQGLGMLGGALFNKKPQAKFGIEPAQFQDQLTLSDADLGQMRQQNLSNIGMMNQANLGSIRQAGAAKRMPAGAMLSSMAGSSYQAARGAANIEPMLRQQQSDSYARFLQLQQPYEMMKAGQGIDNTRQDNQFFGQGFGDMAKTILLWKAGLLGGPATGSGTTGNPVVKQQRYEPYNFA
jgi:hypothetical protein